MEIPKRVCQECGSGNYTFRTRRQIEATTDSPVMLETKFRCKDCEAEWKEREQGVLLKGPRPE